MKTKYKQENPKNENLRNAEEIISYFRDTTGITEYLEFHCRRYEFLLKKIDEIITKIQNESLCKQIKILDVGPSYQTDILRVTLSSEIVNSLGFENSKIITRSQDKHFQFDLNDIQDPDKWPSIEKHHIIIAAEVIEHLYTSQKLVFKCLAGLLEKDGYLIIQTPNAVSLKRRIPMIIGLNPFEMIRESKTDPGHFREYTIAELIAIAKESNLIVKEYSISNYFRRKSIYKENGEYKGIVLNSLCYFLPQTFKDGITICFQKK